MRLRCVLLLTLTGALPLAAQSHEEGSSALIPGKTVSVTAGSHYKAGGMHRTLWGNNYRRLWTTPIDVSVLDLQHDYGGLRPLSQGGGRQTKSLRLAAGDGREFFFRSVDKNGYALLPPDLQATIVGRIWQDQVSSLFPAAALLAAPLLHSAGVQVLQPRLYVMPDDSALGSFRETFAGALGMLEQRPLAPFRGASEIVRTDDMLQRITGDPSQRPDTRTFLAVRLMDMYIGDSDRGASQWLWLKRESRSGVEWQPLGIDRDWAFVSYGGLAVDLVRHRFPKLVNFTGKYPDLIGLHWRASPLDRRLLGDLPRSTWDSVAQLLVSRLTDAAIDSAARALPKQFFAMDGAELTRALRERRDRLPEAADRFYRMLADDAQVYGTEGNDVVSATRGPKGALDLAIRAGNSEHPYFQRRFQSGETKEVRLFLSGGNDSVVIGGKGGGPGLRLLGDSGTKLVANEAKGGWTVLYAPKPVTPVVKSSGSLPVDRRVYRPPDSTTKVLPAPREWGHWWWFSGYLRYDPDRGALLGASTTLFNYGFRKNPYASRVDVLAGYGTTAGKFAGALTLDLRRENSSTHWLFGARASGANVRHFYGLGNETEQVQPKSFYQVFGSEYEVSTAVEWSLSRDLSARVGPVVKYTSTDFSHGGLISDVRPYGSGKFGMLGGRVGLDLDSRDAAAAATRGAHLQLEGTLYPSAWDVDSTFGSLQAQASTYLTAPIRMRPTLALRVAGMHVWGGFPYQEAAFVGGGSTLRGLPSHRFRGESSAYGNAELRVPLSRLTLVAPVQLGIFGLADVGRVWADGESSDTWHSAFGGGVSLAFLAPANTVTAAIAHGDQQTSVYLGTGFMF